jgi:putative glutamine amidotransferase
VLLPPMVDGVAETLAVADGVIFSGGPDLDPATYDARPAAATFGVQTDRDAAELALLRAALERDLPVLGICRGMQLLNVAYGGALAQHLPDVVGHDGHRTEPGRFDVHPVSTLGGSRVASVVGEQPAVCSAHHQGIATVGNGLVASAWAQDGSVEALEDPRKAFVVGVIWHPEEGDDRRLFAALVEAARRRA